MYLKATVAILELGKIAETNSVVGHLSVQGVLRLKEEAQVPKSRRSNCTIIAFENYGKKNKQYDKNKNIHLQSIHHKVC